MPKPKAPTNAVLVYAAAIKLMQQVEHDTEGQEDKLLANKELVHFCDVQGLSLQDIGPIAFMFTLCAEALAAHGILPMFQGKPEFLPKEMLHQHNNGSKNGGKFDA